MNPSEKQQMNHVQPMRGKIVLRVAAWVNVVPLVILGLIEATFVFGGSGPQAALERYDWQALPIHLRFALMIANTTYIIPLFLFPYGCAAWCGFMRSENRPLNWLFVVCLVAWFLAYLLPNLSTLILVNAGWIPMLSGHVMLGTGEFWAVLVFTSILSIPLLVATLLHAIAFRTRPVQV